MSVAFDVVAKNSHSVQAVPSDQMVVMLATGAEDSGQRATLAFSAACTAVSLDKDAQVFLVGEGAYWAYEGRTRGVQMSGFPALEDLVSIFVELGGEIHVCSTCDQVCGIPSDAEAGDLRRRPEIKVRGMAAVLSDISLGSSVTF